MATAAEKVVIATTGGAYERALREAWFDPFSEQTGIEVVTVAGTNAEMRAKAAAMVRSDNVSWDLYLQGDIQASSDEHAQYAQDLSGFCDEQFSNNADLTEDACTAAGVRLLSNATLLAYRQDAFDGAAPESWADMWDLDRLPGGRSFPNFDDPWRVMAAALLADGVSREELFPLDIDRALAKLDKIRPAVSLWWKSGDQSMQGFRHGEYTIGQIWLTRAKALKSEGHPIAWTHKASFLVGDRIALIKNASNQDNALRLLEYWLNSPQAQAQVCDVLSCTPPSEAAMSMMSDEARDDMPSTEEIENHVVVPDAKWINDNAALMLERWNSWIQ
ncbi:extracellular solute-binding protein [Aquamicrobium sp. LC103]|uniref:extracellular solute-binding protein n=1 Tax=Aquamicrobium sp. LC103 TaxID=1120658 RepID=UPI001FEFE204|nr:extracellular solute-binding protein [Aquamicrobium sp. LC103]